jgi:hypothetical protein
MGLLLCARCERHVRSDDEACPFCGATQRQAPSPRAKSRLSRGAMIGAAAVAMACSSGTPQDDAGANDSGPDTVQAAYGGPPIEAGPDVQQKDAAPDGPIAAYGGPPIDAGGG